VVSVAVTAGNSFFNFFRNTLRRTIATSPLRAEVPMSLSSCGLLGLLRFPSSSSLSLSYRP
jgi:hypothetical protein